MYHITTWYVICLCVYLLFNFKINVFIGLIMNIRIGWSCVHRPMCDSRSLTVLFTNFCVHIQCRWPWLMSNDIVLKISKWWGWKKYVWYFDIYRNFSILPLLLKGLHKYSLGIWELFWDEKIVKYFLKKNKKNKKRKTGMHLTP